MTRTPEANEPAPPPATRLAHWPALDHGLIGNGRLLALVSPTSAIEWLCLPRFDSPSIFGRLLDSAKGGTFRFLHRGEEMRGELAYVPNTNVLASRFDTGDAAWEVIDFAPRIPHGVGVRAPLEIVRIVRPLRGRPRLSVDFDPRPDYGRVAPDLCQTTSGVDVLGAGGPLHLTTNVPIPYVLNRSELVLTRPAFFHLRWGRRDEIPSLASVDHDLQRTVDGWRAWARTCALPTFAPDAVLRSALCLKLHAHLDTGAVIAATTTSIPEAMGTPRTWDYRYCWLRDAAFVLEALRRLSHLGEGIQFLDFLRDVAESGPLQPLYGIGGERDLPEEILDHLAGFGGNGWVRVGNAAALQQQNDLMGELVLCLHSQLSDPRAIYDRPADFLPLVERLVEDAIAVAPTPDMGIWEFRTILRPYTFSRAMCWAAIDRGARLAERLGAPELARRWRPIAERERDEILSRAWNPGLGMFTQSLDGDNADAANLLLPTIGIVDGADPRFRATLAAYERILVDRGWVRRYVNLDDFGETHSAFSICSFWWAEALALAGELDRAREVFEFLVSHANPVGLFSEDVDPATGALIGNFPQAYTHVGLIHAAITIGNLLDAREGRVRAWSA